MRVGLVHRVRILCIECNFLSKNLRKKILSIDWQFLVRCGPTLIGKKKKSFFPDVIKNMILNKEYIEPGSLPKINFRNRTHDVPFLEDPIIY